MANVLSNEKREQVLALGRLGWPPPDERLRALPGVDRGGGAPGTPRHGDLAGPGRRPRLLGALRERASVRREAAQRGAARGAPGDRDRAGRGGPGRLRRRPDGAPSRDEEVPALAAVRVHARL